SSSRLTHDTLGPMPDTPAPAPDLPDPAALVSGTLLERMGIELTAVSAERTEGRMPVAGNTQPYGLLHGGASAVLAESLGSVAAATHAGPGRVAVGVDLNCTHHRGVRDGWVTGVATALSLGRSVASYEIVIRDEAGHRVCTARLTCVLRDRAPGG